MGEQESNDQERLGGDAVALATLIALARPARRIVALTGAGISTASGIPDYRGPGGVWERQAPPRLGDFATNPETRRAYWQRRRTEYPAMASAQPNPGHVALARLERAGRLAAIVTQNIDGLHQAAGAAPGHVIELHGSTHVVRCLACGATWPAPTIQARLERGDEVPACAICGGPLRSGAILFGEPLPKDALQRAVAAVRTCDLLLIVGSSLVVNPAAQLPVIAKRAGATLAIVNRTPTPLDALADVRVIGEAAPILTALAEAVLAVRQTDRT